MGPIIKIKKPSGLFLCWQVLLWPVVGILAIWITFSGCQKENILSGSEIQLSFSVDTLVFDTVFTTIGTVTREFKVYNPHPGTVVIRSIRLADAENTGFRLNADGRQGPLVENVTIGAQDSIYVFVEATIDPQNQNNPMIIQDSVIFITNGNIQDVDLVAWGQDVHLINGEILTTQTWINDKPYLVYNSMLVDTNQILDIEAGVTVYLHRGSTCYISGTLRIHGTLDEPVIFRGDRLEKLYEDIPGQWGGFYFLNGSTANQIRHAWIVNATTGIHLGNFYAADPPPDLIIENSIIQHMTFAALSSIGATVEARNSVFADCGYFTSYLTTGGSYEFTHCTFANYWNWSQRITPGLYITNFYNLNDTALFTGELVRADFGNCIIHGNRMNEVGISELEGYGLFRYFFDHCLLKADTSLRVNDPEYFNNPYLNQDPGFISVYDFNFELDTLAFAKDRGSVVIAATIPLDIHGRDRLGDDGPDLGAYERIEAIPGSR